MWQALFDIFGKLWGAGRREVRADFETVVTHWERMAILAEKQLAKAREHLDVTQKRIDYLEEEVLKVYQLHVECQKLTAQQTLDIIRLESRIKTLERAGQ